MSLATARKPAPGSEVSCRRQVHQNCGNPCSMRTSGPSPLSAMWNRLPLELTDRCDHGPSRYTAEPPVTGIRSPRDGRGLPGLLVPAQHRDVALHRFPGLAEPVKTPDLEV